MTMIKVGHILEYYPQKEQDFIHVQILHNETRQDIILAESLIPAIVSVPTTIPVFGYRESLSTQVNPFASHRGLERIRRKWVETLGYQLHIQRLADCFTRAIDHCAVQVIHAHFGMAGAKAIAIRERTQVPLVVTFYGMDASQCLRQPVWLRRYRRLFAVVDRVIVLSEEVKQRLVRYGCPEERIRLWDIGLDLSDFQYHKQPVPSVGTARFLCVARFAEKKGHATLLRAFQQVAKERPEATLTLIGYGPLKAQIQSTASILGVSERLTVIDTQHRTDFKSLFLDALQSHDVFVLASTIAKDGDDEGGPALTLVYAQATGLPVVATNFVGVERSVAHEVTGLLARLDDADDLARQMDRVLSAPGLAYRLGRAGSEFVHEHFSLSKQLMKLGNIYRELL